MKSLFENNDILLLTETWLSDVYNYEVNGFFTFILNRTCKQKGAKRNSGGIIVYVRDTLKQYVEFLKHEDDSIIWFRIKSNRIGCDDDLLLCLCYNIPSGSGREFLVNRNVFDLIADDMYFYQSQYNNACTFLIAGDFNARVGERADYVENESLLNFELLPDDYVEDNGLPRISCDKVVNENGRYLLDLCKATGLRILNGRKDYDSQGHFTCITSQGSSVIDLILCRKEMFSFVENFKVHDANILSDHTVVSFTIKSSGCTDGTEESCGSNDSCNGEKLTHTYKWDSDKKEMFLNSLQSDDLCTEMENLSSRINMSSTFNDMDENLSDLYSYVENVYDPLFKKNVSSHKSDNGMQSKQKQPWYDDECKMFQSDFYKYLNCYRKDKFDDNRENMVRARSKYKSLIRSKKYNYEQQQTRKLENLRSKNAKEYWKLLKSMCVKTTTDCKISTDNFARYFKSINDPDSVFFQPDEEVVLFNERYIKGEFQCMFDELNVNIQMNEVLKACKELKTGKSSGPDLMLNEFFIHGSKIPCFAQCLTALFDKLFTVGYFPSSWSEGFVVPIHKKGNKNDPGNYRGITLLSTLGKLFTKILNVRLTKWAEKYNVYIEAQAGFRQNMSTVDNVFIIHGLINHLLNKNKKLFAVFIDYTKAFDFVVRDIIWYKLIKTGVRGNMLNIVKSMYENFKTSCKVKHNNQLSESFVSTLGVRQGESLSPFLFSMYINDIEEFFMTNGFEGVDIGMLKLFLLLYADDIVLFSESEKGLQHGLNLLEKYCDKWKLQVNINKTKVMIFRKGGGVRKNVSFTYKKEKLEIVNNFKYLGMVFTVGGSFNTTYEALHGQALKAIFRLKGYMVKFPNMSLSHTLDLFDKLIEPILCYGSEVWGMNEANKLETIHMQFCKKILGVKCQTQNSFIYGELGRHPLKLRRLVRVIKYWFKIISSSEEKYVKLVYKMMLSDLENRPEQKYWAKSIKTLLENIGFYHAWLNQGVGNVEVFLSLFKQRIQDNYLQLWNNDLENSSRARTYRLYCNFRYQPYFDIIKPQKVRIAVSRFRLSAHRLGVESGRWHKPASIPYNERKCRLCDSLEDEFHFLLECPLYSDLRKLYIKKYYWCHPNIIKFTELLSSENENVVRKLGLFIYKSFEERNKHYYI